MVNGHRFVKAKRSKSLKWNKNGNGELQDETKE